MKKQSTINLSDAQHGGKKSNTSRRYLNKKNNNKSVGRREQVAAPEIAIHTNISQRPRAQLLEKSTEIRTCRGSKCYVANILIGGIFTKALIDTGAGMTWLSKEFVNNNKE